jgi:hypothetical protein
MKRVFLVEGLITMIFGIALFFLLPDCKPLKGEQARLTRHQSHHKQNGSQKRRKPSSKRDSRKTLHEKQRATLTFEKS